MKTLLNKTLFGLLILLSIFVLGIFIPMILSIFITITTKATLSDCIVTVPFWIFSILGWISAGTYINEEVRKIN